MYVNTNFVSHLADKGLTIEAYQAQILLGMGDFFAGMQIPCLEYITRALKV